MRTFPIILICALTSACVAPVEQEQLRLKLHINKEKPGSIPLPSGTSSQKLHDIGDFNGDGIADLIEIFSVGRLFEKKLAAKIYLGSWDSNHLLEFKNHYEVSLPLTPTSISEEAHIEAADINGDGFDDIVMTTFHPDVGILTPNLGKLPFQFAINAGNGRDFSLISNTVQLGRQDIHQGFMQTVLNVLTVRNDVFKNPQDGFLRMAWADMNGDNREDLVFLWKKLEFASGYQLLFSTIYSLGIVNQEVQMHAAPPLSLPDKILSSWESFEFRLADTNGDKKADVLLTDSNLLNSSLRSVIVPNQFDDGYDSVPKFGLMIQSKMDHANLAHAKFRFTADVNGDGCTDYVFLERSGVETPRLRYYLSP